MISKLAIHGGKKSKKTLMGLENDLGTWRH
jgi:hypothetical protein